MWALTSTGTLARLDAASGRIERRWQGIVPAAGATAGAVALAADPQGAWILAVPQAGPGTLVRVAGDRILRRAAVPSGTLPLLAPGPDGVWTARRDPNGRYRAARLDPRTARTTATVGLGTARPVALADAGARLWAVGGDGTLTAIAS